MKTVGVVTMLGALLVAGAVVAAGEEARQDRGDRRGPPRGREEMRHPREGMNMAGNWVSRFLMQEENLDKLGLEADKRKKLLEGLTEISGKMKELQQKIRETGMEQGKLMHEIMETPGADIAPVLEKVREIGAMRTEQSVLSTKVFVVIRDNLTKEQHKMVRELVMKEGRQRMQARREFNGDMERRRPRFEGGRHGGQQGGDRPGREGPRGRRAREGAKDAPENGARPDGKSAE